MLPSVSLNKQTKCTEKELHIFFSRKLLFIVVPVKSVEIYLFIYFYLMFLPYILPPEFFTLSWGQIINRRIWVTSLLSSPSLFIIWIRSQIWSMAGVCNHLSQEGEHKAGDRSCQANFTANRNFHETTA